MFRWLQDQPTAQLTDIQRAARFYYLQQHAFGGRVEGQSFGTSTTGPVVNLCRIEEALSAAHLRLSGTTIENLPWADCIARYDRPHTFFYMDPPYWQTEGYGVDFPFAEYLAMAERLRSMQGKAMVSINDHPDIRNVFQGLQAFDLDIVYSVGNGRTSPRESKRELVIANFEIGAGGLF